MVIFASPGYGAEAEKTAGRPARRACAAMALLFAVVFVPLTANTVVTFLHHASHEEMTKTPGHSPTKAHRQSERYTFAAPLRGPQFPTECVSPGQNDSAWGRSVGRVGLEPTADGL